MAALRAVAGCRPSSGERGGGNRGEFISMYCASDTFPFLWPAGPIIQMRKLGPFIHSRNPSCKSLDPEPGAGVTTENKPGRDLVCRICQGRQAH